jgi:anti-sigma regulatory factor (Ser/Thr protein kinase)
MYLDPERATCPTGRGIYFAAQDMDKLDYEDQGKKVRCAKKL